MLLLCIFLTVLYFFIGLTDSSFYRMEIIVLPFAFLLSGIITLILIWIKRSWNKKWMTIFTAISSLFLLFLISEHFIRIYKPILNIYIPENFEGVVHLFPVQNAMDKVYIDKNGIGYLPHKGDYQFKVYQGSNDITNVLNESGRGELILHMKDSVHYQSISYSCFEVIKNKTYPKTSWNQKHNQCINEAEFEYLVSKRMIDKELIFKQIWIKE